MKNIILSLSYFLLFITGCQQVQVKMHPWQYSGNQFAVFLKVNDWDVVPSRHLGRVSSEYISEAEKKLEMSEFIRISPEYAKKICSKTNFKNIENCSPYLIRGVSYNNCPAYSIVKKNKDSWIYIYQATYDGEIYIPGRKYVPVESPIVIYLNENPKKVFSVADVGGDRIFRGVDFKSTWEE